MRKLILWIVALSLVLSMTCIPVFGSSSEAISPDLLGLVISSDQTASNLVTDGPAVVTTGTPAISRGTTINMDMAAVNSSNYYTVNMYFDSNTSNTPNTSYTDLVNSFSMEVYFTLPETVSATGYIAKFMHWNGGVGLQVAKDGENLKLQGVWGSGKTTVGNAPVEAGKSYHAVLTWSLSGNTNTMELFVDGVQVASANGTGNMMTEGAAGSRTLTIGDGVGGKIGLFNMYYDALTTEQVTQAYKQNVQDKQGIFANLIELDFDTTGVGNNALHAGPQVVTTGTPTLSEDAYTGMDMAAVNSSNYYTVNMYFENNTSNTPNTSYTDLVNSFSMEVYFTLPETVSATGYIAKFMHWNGGVGLQVAKDGDNLTLQGVWGASKTVVGNAPVEAGKSYHAVLTWSLSGNTNTMELFVDGVQAASANGSGNMMTEGAAGGRTLTIGDGVGGKIGLFNMYYSALDNDAVEIIYKDHVKDLADAKAEQDQGDSDSDQGGNDQDQGDNNPDQGGNDQDQGDNNTDQGGNDQDQEDNTQTGDAALFVIGLMLVCAFGMCFLGMKKAQYK